MKNLRTLLAVGFLAIITSCSTTKGTSTRTVKDNTSIVDVDRGRSNQNTEQAQTNNSRQLSSKRVSTTGAVRNNEAFYRERNQNMYKTLNLDDTQITRFENDWKNSTNTWKRNNRNKEMNSFERTEYQDRIMKDILDKKDFEVYQEWARENPITD